IAPFARELDRGLDRFRAGVHWQRHVHLRGIAQLLEERAEPIVVHRPRRQRQPAGLSEQRLQDTRVTMALIQRGVGADAIEVLPSLDIPCKDALCPCDDDRERRVVVSADAIRLRDDLIRSLHSAYFVSAPPRRARICCPNRLSTSSTASSAVRLRSSNAGL